MGFTEKLQNASRENRSLLCVGLDPEWERLPADLREEGPRLALYEFCAQIVDATKDSVCAYKPNAAFFEAHGYQGVRALEELIRYIPGHIPVILDAKRGDIGNTAKAYAKSAFDVMGADAITVAPYMGWDSVEPFASVKGKGVFVLCRTSNPGARDFQDLQVPAPGGGTRHLYEHVAEQVATWRKQHKAELGVVAGATYPQELGKVRALLGESAPILIPGVGAQGASPRDAVLLGGNVQGDLAVVNVGRSILYDANPGKAAQAFRDDLNKHRPK